MAKGSGFIAGALLGVLGGVLLGSNGIFEIMINKDKKDSAEVEATEATDENGEKGYGIKADETASATDMLHVSEVQEGKVPDDKWSLEYLSLQADLPKHQIQKLTRLGKISAVTDEKGRNFYNKTDLALLQSHPEWNDLEAEGWSKDKTADGVADEAANFAG
jgi:hypothetical protein